MIIIRELRLVALAFVALFWNSSAFAAPVVLNDLQNQTVDGQNFNFVFNGLTPSDGTGGTLVLRARGDYDGGSVESLDWTAEGVFGATGVGGFVDGINGSGGPFDFVNLFIPFRDIEWQRTYVLSNADLTMLLADLIINISVDLDSEVGALELPRFVEITINYNSDVAVVPLPAAFPLFAGGLGLMGLLGWRKRRKAAAAPG